MVTLGGTGFTTSGLLNSDAVASVTLNSSGAGETATVAGSPYTIVPSAAVGAGLNNYTITYANGTLTVNPAALIITADNRTKTYGQSVNFAGTEFTSSGLLNNDTVTSVALNSPGALATATVAGSPYAIVPSAAVGTGLPNYTITYVNGTLTVVAATLIITWANPAPIFYGTALTAAQLDATANVSGSFAYTPTNGSVLNAGTNTLSVIFTPSDTTDYVNATNTVSLIVSNAPLVVTAASTNRAYGQANPVFSGTLIGVTNGDNITAVYSTTAAISSVLGTYAIVPSLVDPNDRQTNYTVSLVNGTLTIGQATPMMTWTNPAPISYGAAITTNELNAAANVPGSFAYTPTNGAVLNTGSNTLSVIFTPTDTVDYRSLTDTVTVVVSPAPLTVTASNFSRPFDTGNPEFTGTITGLTNGDDITAMFTCGATISSPVGTYAIAPSLVDPNDRQTNYVVTLVDGILVVGHPTQVFTWTNPAPITYGTALTSVQLNATANVPGTYAYNPTNGAVLTTGTNTLSVTFTPSDSVDYVGVTNSVSLVVSPAPLTVAGANTNRQYGQANPVFTGAITGLTNGDTITAAFNCSATPTSPVGTYAVVPGTAVGADLTNYTITYANGTLTVNPATLTITAENRTKTYGQTVTFAGTEFTSGGLLNNDTVSSVTLASSGAAATATVAVSPFTIVPSAAVGTGLNNYTITYANGTLTVNPATLTVRADSQTKTYGQTVSFAGTEFTTRGLLNSDTVNSATLTSSGAPAVATVAGSPYTIVPSAPVGTGLNNYTITYANGTLTVTPAALTVTANNRTKSYGQTVIFAGTEFTSSGLLNNDTLTSVTLASSGATATATVAGSPYTIVPSAAVGTGLADYTIIYVNGSLTVSEATVTTTWANPAPIIYGAALTAAQLDATANVSGSFAYTPANGSVLNAGTNTLSVVFTPADTVDYSNANNTVSLIVSNAPLVATAASANRVYGQTNPVLTGEITGVTNGDNITATYSTTATISSPLGAYPIVPTLLDPDDRQTNYTVNLVNGTLTVGQATPIMTWTNPAPIVYGAALTTNQLNAPVNVPGSFAYTPTNGAVLNTGSNTLSVVFTPSDMVDYRSLTDAVTVVVFPAPLSVTASSFTRPFDTANPEFTGTISGLTNGDDITATFTCSATISSPVGTYAIVPSLVDPNDRQTNYVVSLMNGILVVGHPAQVFTWANPAPITYGTALTSVLLDAAANVLGSYAYNPTNGAVLNSGTNTLSVIFTPSDTVDYVGVTDSVSVVILPALLVVTANDTNREFGQANPLFTGTITGLTNGDDITANYTCSATTPSKVGTYVIVATLVDPDDRQTNYTVSLIDGNLDVSKATPILMWTNPASINYGSAVTTNQLDASANVPGNFAYDPTNDTVLDTGANALSVIFTATDNVDYSNATKTVSLVVTPAPLTVTAASFSRQIGATNPVFTGTIAGLTNGDDITATYNCSATSNSPVGTYPIVPSLVDPNHRQTNYMVSLDDGLLTVTSTQVIDIKSAKQSGNVFVLAWSSTPAETYQIQYTTNLSRNVWVNLRSPIAATNSTASASDPITNSEMFYRIMLLP
jgi:hypothetical protein